MKIAVIGAGGVGGYFGGRLAAAGTQVSFIARGAHRDAMRATGLRIESALGDALVPVTVADRTEEVGPVDVAIVAVKLFDTERVVATIGPLIGPQTVVISLQNGVSKDDRLRAALGAKHVAGGLCYIGTAIEAPGVIRHTGTMARLVVGETDGSPSPRLESFARACRAAGIDITVSSDVTRATWEKFVFLVGLSGATSTIRQTVGPLRADANARALLRALFQETLDVGRARGVALDPAFADERLAFCDTLPATMTSSMHHDLEHGKPLELPWLQGTVVEFGRAAGIPTPANAFVVAALSLYRNGAGVLA
ncbi:MAG: 2-dehydropantoate 2-reductase [Candidatus Velthaea sp.]